MPPKCRWCAISFTNGKDHQKHMAKDIGKHLYYCQVCKCTFTKFKTLEKHFKTSPNHFNEDETKYMKDSDSYCRRCRRQFATAGDLAGHLSKAHTDKCCETCGARFKDKNKLRSHNASPVHNKRDIPCPHCGRLFKTTSGVARYLESKCLKKVTEMVVEWDADNQITDPVYTDRIEEIDSEDDYVLVGRREKRLPQILEAMVTADEGVQAYLCPVPDCGRKFAKLLGVNQHLASQKHRTDPTTFHCPKCQLRFSVISALIQHLESEVCGLAQSQMVKEIYTSLHDMFKKLLKF